MATKIGVITTGGTIGSILSGDAMAVDPGGEIVRDEIKALSERHGFEVVVRAAFNKNSEDVAPADWGTLINAVAALIDDGVSRIVVTHGTDTLAYSSAALALVFRQADVHICLTGSFHALEAENSDGPLNLLAAFHAVAEDVLSPGVYVAFRRDASNTVASIYDALDLKPMAFDDLAFQSVGHRCLATFEPAGVLKRDGDVVVRDAPAVAATRFAVEALSVAARQVLCIDHYPGVAFDRIDHTRLHVLIVGLYHSGTGYAASGQGSLRALMNHKHDELAVVAATLPSAHISVPYQSTATLMEAGVPIVQDLPLHVLYVFTVLELARGTAIDDVVAKLKPWLLRPGGGAGGST